ncbi:MAG: hypothetical protein GEU79_11875 [Acidimicrobiia bacterium]|nr:hypothetical protein [Acidimicrobiia bacterium]
MDRLYLRSLIRLHLSISFVHLGVFAIIALGLPILFWAFPTVAAYRVGPIPLAWVVLGGGGYPVLIAIGWSYVRSVEEAEAEYAELVDEP